MQKKLLIKQLEIDMNQTLESLNKHYFGTSDSTDAMRYWSRGNGTIIVKDGYLLCRTENPELTKMLETKYHGCNAQWFGEVSNMKALEQLLQEFGYTITNYAPFYVPIDPFMSYYDDAIQFYDRDEILQFKDNPSFSECFCFEEQDPDVLGAALKIDGIIAGMAGINHNGQNALEIGINILPEYQHLGYAQRLVKAITTEAMNRFPNFMITYGTQFTHMQSINVASGAGFKYGFSQIIFSKINDK